MNAPRKASRKKTTAPTVKLSLARLGIVTIIVLNMGAIVNGDDAVNGELLDSCCGIQADGEAEHLFHRATRLRILEDNREEILLACLAATR